MAGHALVDGNGHRRQSFHLDRHRSISPMLTEDMIRVVRKHRLGFVATTNPNGTPNLSPKGTFVVIDQQHLISYA